MLKYPKGSCRLYSDENFDKGGPGNGASSGNDNDDDNCVTFAANGSIVVSQTACIANCMSENLLKLRTDMVKMVVEWCMDARVHCDYLAKLNELYTTITKIDIVNILPS